MTSFQERTASRRFTEHQFVPVWIRGTVPDCGNATLMVTTHKTEAYLWRSQGYVVTQAFMVVNSLVLV